LFGLKGHLGQASTSRQAAEWTQYRDGAPGVMNLQKISKENQHGLQVGCKRDSSSAFRTLPNPALMRRNRFDGDIRWPRIDLIGSFLPLPGPL
jgi:hypothetical protein